MKIVILLLFTLFGLNLFGQTPEEKYTKLIKKADNLYRVKNYKISGIAFSQAFKSYPKLVSINDRFNAACSWALADLADSAFRQLQTLALQNKYANIEQITSEHDLSSLHKDKRWKPLIELIKKNKEKIEAKFNLPLILKLDTIFFKDQNNRNKISEIESINGPKSKELIELWRQIQYQDSLNLVQLEIILDSFGWLGPDVIGERGNTTLFLVIQHSDLKTQEKYLPMMRKAVKMGNALPSDLALLEDRVALLNGKKQIYGSQVIQDSITGKYKFAPIDDPGNVNKRRALVRLEPIEEYAKYFGIELMSKSNSTPKAKNCFHMDFESALEIQDSIVTINDICMGFGRQLDYSLDKTYKERNSTWFKLTIDRDTVLTFDIVPYYFKEDYDFILFNCNDVNCINELRENKIKPERFCFSVNEEKYGATGLSHYENQKVVGAGYGIGYVSALPVKKGEVYYLMVNYAENSYKSGSNVGSGFTIYFYNYWPKKPPFLKSKDPSKVYLVLDNILFETNKTSLSNANKKALDNLGKQLIENKTTYISIEGFTDNVGADSLNQKLSEERATAVKSYLIAKGVESSRIRTKGLGSKNAVASNKNEKGRIKNRRVELRVLNYP